MWPTLLTLVCATTPSPTTPIQWDTLGSSKTAKAVQAAHAALEKDGTLSDALLAKLGGEDRAYFEARRLASTGSLDELYAQISKLSSVELKHDIEGRWLKRFADDGLTVTRSQWKRFAATLTGFLPALSSQHHGALRRFALDRPGHALKTYEELLKRVEPGSRVEGTLTYMAIVAMLELKPVDEAKLSRLRETLYTSHTLHPLTPRRPPKGVSFPSDLWLKRIETLVEGHLNERALDELKRFKKKRKLTAAQSCRSAFIEGLAHRKLRKYKSAEGALAKAASACRDRDYKRRAHYLWAKVVSIRDGLAAIKPIESFVKRFPKHSMADDVLFWAGDVYQRRERWEEADAYYERVQREEHRGDYCAEARWRRAWMSYVNEDWKSAATKLRAATRRDCDVDAQALARAEYWLGMIESKLGNESKALEVWERLVKRSPLSFYSQLVFGRLPELAPSKRLAWRSYLPSQKTPVTFCSGSLAQEKAWTSTFQWIERGYTELALGALRAVDWDSATLGVGPGCLVKSPKVVEAFAYKHLGDDDRGYRILRTLWKDPSAQTELIGNKTFLSLLYPDLFSDILAKSEKTYGLPSYFLQALAREESSFHPQIASWAGARGLLQLMPGTAKRIAKRAKIRYKGEGDLLDPTINASLGGALMRELSRKFKGDPAAMLAGYNASQKASSTWRSRYLEKDIDQMIENISVKETRKYVKRVLETWGIYRWLYGQEAIALKPWQVGEKLTWNGGR